MILFCASQQLSLCKNGFQVPRRSCAIQLVAGTNYAFEFQAYFDCTTPQRMASFGSVSLDAIIYQPLQRQGQNVTPQVRHKALMNIQLPAQSNLLKLYDNAVLFL